MVPSQTPHAEPDNIQQAFPQFLQEDWDSISRLKALCSKSCPFQYSSNILIFDAVREQSRIMVSKNKTIKAEMAREKSKQGMQDSFVTVMTIQEVIISIVSNNLKY
jgi:hypothetical protein